MKINVFSIKFAGKPEMEPTTVEVDADEDVNTAIAAFFMKSCGAVPTFCWEYAGDDEADDNEDDNVLDDQYSSVNDFAEEIRHLLRRYFECDDNGDKNAEYDPEYTAQDCIDEIRELVGNI